MTQITSPYRICYFEFVIQRMTNEEALDIIFSFFTETVLEKAKEGGLYDLVLSKKVSTGAEIYDWLDEEYSALQDADYSMLADAMGPVLKKGSILQIGCGRGDLLQRLAEKGFAPLRGIDRSEVMLRKAKERLNGFNAELFCERIENFNYSRIGIVENVVINNFWGMVSEEESEKVLKKLRNHLAKDGIIIIGPRPGKNDIIKILAEKTLRKNLDFTFSYPFYNDFDRCGYDSKITELLGLKYIVLSAPMAISPFIFFQYLLRVIHNLINRL